MPKAKCCIAKKADVGGDSNINKAEASQKDAIPPQPLNNENLNNQQQNKRFDYGMMGCQKLKFLSYNKVIDQLPKSNAPTTSDPSDTHNKMKKIINKTMEANAIPNDINDKETSISLLHELCERLNCPQLSFQMEKLNAAQEQLMRLQHRDLFDQIFGPNFLCFCTAKPKPNPNPLPKLNNKIKNKLKVSATDYSNEMTIDECEAEKLGEEEECICFGTSGELMELKPENEWHGFFKGYEMLCESNDFSLNEIKKCIEIGHMDTVESIEVYLRAGVRCFMIDLFKGNNNRNQTIVVRFRQSELNVAKELGFPITSTLFARLSPRLQYTGYLVIPFEYFILCNDDNITLTVDRYWASQCSKRRIYVNARYLLPDLMPFDIILIGNMIQLMIIRIMTDSIRCKVICGGILRSRMPVLFNKRCNRFRLSFCELEDITFVKEVDINVIVSDMIGTKAYFENLCFSLKLLQCENLRIYARVVLNNIDDDDDDDDNINKTNIDWALNAYDGFMGEITQFLDGCGGDGNIMSYDELPNDRILFLNQRMRKLIEDAHRMHKPFIFDPTMVVNGNYVLDPQSYNIVLYHPDKYLVSGDQTDSPTIFYMLANALSTPMSAEELNNQMPFCDESHTGSDSLALSTVAASLEMDASCIFVVGQTGRMVTKIASFRPKATIYFISSLKSIANFVSIHHNVVMLYYHNPIIDVSHRKSVYTQFLFGISYALKLKTLQDGDHVIFVYGQKPGQLFLDKYVAYKFDGKNFITELAKILY